MSEKGRWFRVYARQVDEHAKFRDLSVVELGAWMALRSEAELRDRAMIRSADEAVLILRRRRTPRPRAVLAHLIDLRLFDVDADGRLTVHDRADHDRPQYPSDAPDQSAERKRRSRASHESVTTRDMSGGDSGHDTHARVQPQQAEPSPSIQPTAPASAPADGLPGEADSATFACRMFLNGGRWLSDAEYAEAWDELDRRYTPAWVQAEIQPAYAELHGTANRVKPWDLKRLVELRLAERARSEEHARERERIERDRQTTEEMRAKAEAATEEDRERASVIRRAVKLWLSRRPKDPIPTDFDALRSWLDENEPRGLQGAPA